MVRLSAAKAATTVQIYSRLDTAFVYNRLPTKLHYVIYAQKGSNEIAKITAYGSNAKQKLTPIYCYANATVIKAMTKIIDFDPFECTVYYHGENPFSERSSAAYGGVFKRVVKAFS